MIVDCRPHLFDQMLKDDRILHLTTSQRCLQLREQSTMLARDEIRRPTKMLPRTLKTPNEKRTLWLRIVCKATTPAPSLLRM